MPIFRGITAEFVCAGIWRIGYSHPAVKGGGSVNGGVELSSVHRGASDIDDGGRLNGTRPRCQSSKWENSQVSEDEPISGSRSNVLSFAGAKKLAHKGAFDRPHYPIAADVRCATPNAQEGQLLVRLRRALVILELLGPPWTD